MIVVDDIDAEIINFKDSSTSINRIVVDNDTSKKSVGRNSA